MIAKFDDAQAHECHITEGMLEQILLLVSHIELFKKISIYVKDHWLFMHYFFGNIYCSRKYLLMIYSCKGSLAVYGLFLL